MENISVLDKKLQRLGADYIFCEALNSVLLLAMGQTETAMEKRVIPNIEVPKKLSEIKSEIKNMFLDLKSILGSSTEEKDNVINRCLSMKKEIKEIFKTVYAYSALWSAVIELLYDKEASEDIKGRDITVNTQMLNILCSDCLSYINESDSFPESKARSGRLLSCLPLKITRAKYFEDVKLGLYNIFNTAAEDSILNTLNSYELVFTPMGSSYWKDTFKDIYDVINEHIVLDFKNLTAKEAKEIIENTEFINRALITIEDYCQDLIDDLSSIIVAAFSGFTFSELMSESPQNADIFNKAVELVAKATRADYELFGESVLSMSESAIESLSEKCISINKEESKLFEKLSEDYNLLDDTKKIISTKIYIMDCFYDNLLDSIFDFNESDIRPADNSFKESAINEFILRITDSFSKLPNALRKIFMKRLIYFLPTDLSPYEVVSGITDAISSEIRLEDKLLIINKLGAILDSELIEHDSCGCHDHDSCDCHDHDSCDCHDHHR